MAWSPALDGLRGYAVVAVVAFHASQWRATGASQVFLGGALGVDLFFVLSGFLITHLLLVEIHRTGTIRLRRFYARRAVRLLPALATMLGFFTLVFISFEGARFVGGQSPGILAKTWAVVVSYSANWVSALGDERARGTGHLWSLAVEEQFYLLWPLLLIGFAKLKRPDRAFWATSMALFAGSALLPIWITDPDRLYFGTDFRLHQLLVGAMFGHAFTTGRLDATLARRPAARLAYGLSAVGLVGIVLLLDDRSALMITGGFTAVAILSGLVVAGAVFDESRAGAVLLGNRLITYVGRRSYALYLWHYPLVVWLRDVEGPVYYLLVTALSLAAAEASHHLVERPMATWRDSGWAINRRHTASGHPRPA